MPMNNRLMVPRANGFSPGSISGLALWLDASDSSTVTTATGVSQWNDKSGNGVNATQGTTGSQPAYTAGGLNGRNVLTLDGTDDWLGFSGTSRTDETLFVVCTATMSGGGVKNQAPAGDAVSGNVGITVVIKNDGSPTSSVENFLGGTTTGITRARWTFAANAPLPATILSYRRSSSLGGLGYQNGTPSGSCTTSLASTLARIGQTANTNFHGGIIAEVIVYNRALTAAEHARVVSYLGSKWGIAVAAPPVVSNSEAQFWIDRTYANGGTVSQATANAVSDFCDAIEAASLRDRFYRLNLFAGDGLTAALVPLYRGPVFGGTTYGNTTDTNEGPFVGADYSLTSGLKSNGSKRLKTGLLPSQVGSDGGSVHAGAYIATANTLGAYSHILGATAAGSACHSILHRLNAEAAPNNGATHSTYNSAAASVYSGVNNPTGFVLGSSVATNDNRIFINGAQSGSTAVGASIPSRQSTYDYYVFADNRSGTASFPTDARMSMYTIGTGLTAAEVALYYAAVTAFNTALGRS